ncbi:MAG: hypothetical protein ABI474_09295 [Actinomycetota bacterium]
MSEVEIAVVGPERHGHRPAPVDTEPSGRLDEVLGLLDELTKVARASEGLFRGVEQVTGLRAGEVHVLLACAYGASAVRDVARRIGELDDAAGATVESLIQRGLLARNHCEDSGEGSSVPGFLQLTDQGAAVLEQIEGVQVRLLDTLVGGQGEQGVPGFRATLQAITEVWNSVASHAEHLELRAGPR